MRVTIEIQHGPNHDDMVTKKGIQKNIDALLRAINGKPMCSDFILLNDTMSILEAIQKKLPD